MCPELDKLNGYKKTALRRLYVLAERKRFELSIGDKPYTPLAGERLQPLGHLSKRAAHSIKIYQTVKFRRDLYLRDERF